MGRTPRPTDDLWLRVTRHEANQRIGKQVIDGEALERLQVRSYAALEEARSRFDRWRVSTEGLLLEVFDGPDPLHHYRFQGKMTFDWMSRDKGFARDRRRFGMAVSSHRRALEFYLSILPYLAESVPSSPASAPPLEVPEVNPVEEDALLLLEVMLQEEDPGPGGFSAEWLTDQTGLSGRRLGAAVTFIERMTGSLVPRASNDGPAGFVNLHLDLSASHLYHELKAQHEEETLMEPDAIPPLPRLQKGKDRESLRGKIEELMERGRNVCKLPTGTVEQYHQAQRDLENWTAITAAVLSSSLDSSAWANWFVGPQQRPSPLPYRPDRAAREFEGLTNNRLARLESLREQLSYMGDPAPARQSGTRGVASASRQRRVFIVHGHDEAAKQSVARFVQRLDHDPIILEEQPSAGRTIIEKFVSYARQVSFAIVLLTPDDIGGPAGQPEAEQERARQNVVFELGYFTGKLGRGKVCLLKKGEVEIPSDLYGVVYVPFDPHDGWHVKVAREMKAAKLQIDLNKLL